MNTMKLKYFVHNAVFKEPLAVLRIEGNLSFNVISLAKFNINENSIFKIGVEDDYESTKIIYLISTEEKSSEAFKINKSGKYMFLRAKMVFDKLEIDYKNKIQTYIVAEFSDDGIKGYKLTLFEEKER